MADLDSMDLDGEILASIRKRKKEREQLAAMEQEEPDNPLGKAALAMASGLGGYLTGRPGGELAAGVMDGRRKEQDRARDLRMKALGQHDETIKELTDLAKLRAVRSKEEKKDEALTDPSQRLMKAPAEVRSKIGLIANAMQNVTDYEGAFAKGSKPSYINANTPLIGGLMSDDPVTIAQRQMNETIGRLNSGGVIGKEEIPTFQAMGPRPGDSPEVMAKKLNDFRDAMALRLSAFGFQPEELGRVKGFDAGKMGYSDEAKLRRQQLLSQHQASQNLIDQGSHAFAGAGASGNSIKTEGGVTKVRMGNGHETLWVNADDVEAAQAEGFQVIR